MQHALLNWNIRHRVHVMWCFSACGNWRHGRVFVSVGQQGTIRCISKGQRSRPQWDGEPRKTSRNFCPWWQGFSKGGEVWVRVYCTVWSSLCSLLCQSYVLCYFENTNSWPLTTDQWSWSLGVISELTYLLICWLIVCDKVSELKKTEELRDVKVTSVLWWSLGGYKFIYCCVCVAKTPGYCNTFADYLTVWYIQNIHVYSEATRLRLKIKHYLNVPA